MVLLGMVGFYRKDLSRINLLLRHSEPIWVGKIPLLIRDLSQNVSGEERKERDRGPVHIGFS